MIGVSRMKDVAPRRLLGYMKRPGDPFSSKSIRAYRLTIVTQLLQTIEAMHRPEEMFQWLAYAIVQHFNVSIMQFWTRESNWTGQPSAQLRAMAYQDRTLPANLIGAKVSTIIEQIPKEHRIFPPQLLEQVLPRFQASLLKRYGLNYCSYCLIDKNVRFAPAGYARSRENVSTGLTFIAFLLLRNYPPLELIPNIGTLLEQAIGIAEKRQLLLPVAPHSGMLLLPAPKLPSQEILPPGASPALLGLIPQLKHAERLMMLSNPLASLVTISDKRARRLYTAIDGRKTVDELRSVGMTLHEVLTALKALVNQQRIELYTPEGQLVDAAPLFK